MAKFATACTFTRGKSMQGPNMMFGRRDARVGFKSKSLTSQTGVVNLLFAIGL